jgi:competence protein ComEA
MKHFRKSGIVVVLAIAALMVAGAAWATDQGKININTASVEQLVQLKGVGQKIAEAIVKYREANGPFKAPEDLMQVSGIGEKTFANNKDRISVK